MTNFLSIFSKLVNRKKTNGYYEASDILSVKEKQTIVITLSSLVIPLLISVVIIFVS